MYAIQKSVLLIFQIVYFKGNKFTSQINLCIHFILSMITKCIKYNKNKRPFTSGETMFWLILKSASQPLEALPLLRALCTIRKYCTMLLLRSHKSLGILGVTSRNYRTVQKARQANQPVKIEQLPVLNRKSFSTLKPIYLPYILSRILNSIQDCTVKCSCLLTSPLNRRTLQCTPAT